MQFSQYVTDSFPSSMRILDRVAGNADTHVIIADDGDSRRVCVPQQDTVAFATHYSEAPAQHRGSVYEIPNRGGGGGGKKRCRLQFRIEGDGENDSASRNRCYAEAYSACVSVLVDKWTPDRTTGHLGALVLSRESDKTFAMVFPGVVTSTADMRPLEQILKSKMEGLCVFERMKILFPCDVDHWPLYGSPPKAYEDALKGKTGIVPEEADAWDWEGVRRNVAASSGTVLSMHVSCPDLLALGKHAMTPGSDLLTRANITSNKEYLFWMTVSCSIGAAENTPAVTRASAPRENTGADEDEKENDRPPGTSGANGEGREKFMLFDMQQQDMEIDPNVESSLVGTLTRKEAVRSMLKSVDPEFFNGSGADAKRSVTRGLVNLCMSKRMAKELAEEEHSGLFEDADFESGSRYDRASFVTCCSDGDRKTRATWVDSFCIRLLDNASKSLTNDDLVSYIREIYDGFMVLSSTGQTKVWYTCENGFWKVNVGGSNLDTGVKDNLKRALGAEISRVVQMKTACEDLKRRLKLASGGGGSVAGSMLSFCADRREFLGLADQQFYAPNEALQALSWHLSVKLSRQTVMACDLMTAEKLADVCVSLCKMHEERRESLFKLLNKIKTHSWWVGTKKSMQSYFLDSEFRPRLDSNKKLLGMRNGVFDLDIVGIRQAMPCDYVSKKMPFSYRTYEEGDPTLKETKGIIARIFPNKKLRDYFWQMTALMLEGKNITKTIQVWTGCGDNGKTVLMNFLKAVFGPYFAVIPTTCASGKKPQAGSATPELAKLGGGVRVVFMNEPNQNEVLNTATLKNWSGNDPMYVRALFDNGYEMVPMFKIVLICNDLPQVGNHDAAFWGRIRVVPFKSRFTHDAPKDITKQWKAKHFARDDAIEDSFETLAPALFYLVVRAYENIHSADGGVRLVDPWEVLKATENYRSTSNCYNLFVEQIFDTSPDAAEHRLAKVRDIPAVYALFRNWFRDSFPSGKINSMPVFMRAVRAVLPDVDTAKMLCKSDTAMVAAGGYGGGY